MTTLTSVDGTCTFGTGHPTVLAAMSINTLRNREFAERLAQGDLDAVKRLAEMQRLNGVGFLQIMLAHPELDEKQLLPEVCLAAHDASGLPLYIDSGDVEAIERTLDAFPYKPIISVNGEEEKMRAILPLVMDSGCAVICLCLDEVGIPDSVEGRMQVAEKIIERALAEGIDPDDLVIDPLVMAAGAVDPDSMHITLGTLRAVKERWGYATFLGIDNAGFGMPQKDLIDMAYLLACIPAGMDAALLEPPTCSTIGIEGLVLLFAGNFISGRDPYGKELLKFVREHGLVNKPARS